MGSIGMEMPITRFLAARVGAVTCSVNYRLAPEHVFPAAADDAYDGAIALLSGEGVPAELRERYDPLNSAIFGVSAGGYITANTALLLAHGGKIDTAGWKVKTHAMVVPMAVPFGGTESMVRYFHAPIWSGTMNHWAWSMYLRGDNGTHLREDWRVNHLKAPVSLLKKLPPAYVSLSNQDTLYSEGKLYSEILQDAGVLTTLHEHDTSHVGQILGGTIGDKAMVQLVSHLRASLR
jgi:acetyl esterase